MSLKSKLIRSINEKDVENIYRSELSRIEGSTITSPYGIDGLLTAKNIRTLLEFKYDEDLKNKLSQSNILIQCLYYLKKFEANGDKLPSTIFVGDTNECFAIHTNSIVKYLSSEIDWKIAPSEAHKNNQDLIFAMVNDVDILPFVFDINHDFEIKTVIDKIKDFSDNVIRKIRVTNHNIVSIFDYFDKNILGDTKLTTNEKANLFIQIIINNNDNYLHPKRNHVLTTKSYGDIKVNSNLFKSFFKHFEGTLYSPKEKEQLTGLVDRLVMDTVRREKGEFFTPTPFVDLAHKYISNTFGEDWKEKYVVWDNCFDSETEFLCETGWKRISEYVKGDKVLQYNEDESTNFVNPIKYIKQKYNDSWLELKNSAIQIRTTKDHNYVLKNNKHNVLYKDNAINVFNEFHRIKNTHLTIPISFDYSGDLSINENILRLAVAINADGSYCPLSTLGEHKDRTKRNTRFTVEDTSIRDVYKITVKKQRKIDRSKLLLETANIEYVETISGGYTTLRFKFPFNAKEYPKEWYNLDKKSKEIIIDEVFYWDGNIIENKFGGAKVSYRKTYSTSNKNNFDFIQFCIHSLGFSTNVREDKRSKNTNYVLAIRKFKTSQISGRNNSFTKTNGGLDEYSYCFTVDSGMLVVRRKNKIFISSNCWGTGNLTRDYKFKELYCSTLEQSDIDTANQMGYNPEATKFRFDFLNDPDSKLPQGLQDAIRSGRGIIFLMNPPYAGVGNFKTDGVSKFNILDTLIGSKMKVSKNWGASTSQLYAQFIYRIYEYQKLNKNINIGLFCPPLYMTGGSFVKFRKMFFSSFGYEKGFLFQASHFSNVSAQWGINFAVFSNKINNIISYVHDLVELNLNSMSLDIIGSKTMYNTDDNTVRGNVWVKDSKANRNIITPTLKSSLSIGDKAKKTNNNSLGELVVHNNNCKSNSTQVYLLTVPANVDNGQVITTINFNRAVTLFTARKPIQTDWINQKDEYLAPNEQHPDYEQFTNDSLVYSLFNNSSQQSSLRQVDYKDKKWDIKNEFFWLSKQEMLDLAEENHYDNLYKDARTSNERFVYKNLFEEGIYEKLSPDAKEVLDMATDLLKKSIKMRMLMSENHNEYHLDSWDAGYAQLKLVWGEYFKDEFKLFRDKYRELEDKMRPLVYDLGFLRK